MRSAAAAAAISRPARTLPVTAISRTAGWAVSARPVSRSPQTMLSTPGGRCSAAIRASRADEEGVVSAGLSTVVFPAAIAGAIFHAAIIKG